MSAVEKTIEVNKPLTTVYNQWTKFEEFLHFMEGVEREFISKIVEQTPDKKIS